MPETWMVSVGGRSYGPYSGAQMHAFAAEGRLAAHSLVARDGDTRYQAAVEDPALAHLFLPSAPGGPVRKSDTPGAGSTTFGRSDKDESRTGERAQFVILADMKSRSVQALEEEIFNLGPAFAVLPHAWVVTTDQSVNAVRNSLVQKLGKLDVLFVVDATHNKAAWFNLGLEADARIRRIWKKSPAEADAARKAAS